MAVQAPPVQPEVVLEAPASDVAAKEPAQPSRRRWWWHSKLRAGDVVVRDMLRSPRGSFELAGESALSRIADLARSLAAALRGPSNGDLRGAVRACGGIDEHVLDPVPFPAIGERYVVTTEPTALLRRLESVESDVVAEMRPGSIVTVLEVG